PAVMSLINLNSISDRELPQLAMAGERLPMPMLEKLYKKRAPAALAWVSYFGHTMKSLPGASSALAADHLVARRDELKKGPLTDELKQELAAIEQALAGVDAAAARLESSAPFWSHRGWDYR